jgi:hypothetical protein
VREDHPRHRINPTRDIGVGKNIGERRNIELVGDSPFRVKFGDKCMCEYVAQLCSWGDTMD